MGTFAQNDLHPYYLGAYAENDSIFEEALLELFRDHAYWRRNFHPENRPPIPTNARYRDNFNEFLARMQQELHTLSADLKKSVPFFSPRYMGQMAADYLIPGILAQIMTLFYSPTNVSEEAHPTSLQKELKAAAQLAAMLGFNTNPEKTPYAWGHLTSGPIIANYEGLSNLRSIKFYPVALQSGLHNLGIDIPHVGPARQNLRRYTKWELFNLSIADTVALMNASLDWLDAEVPEKDRQKIAHSILSESLEHLGSAGFFLKHPELRFPKLLLPLSSQDVWEKIARHLGLGIGQLVPIQTDAHMRLRIDHLEEVMGQHFQRQEPVLATIGVLSHAEFGGIDPISEMVQIRNQWSEKGLYSGIHVDGTRGGYLATIFRNSDGSLEPLEHIRKDFKFFPTPWVWEAFNTLPQADSVSLDPHQMGYLSFPCGAYICRDAGVLDLLNPKPAHSAPRIKESMTLAVQRKLHNLGAHIMEDSKLGSSAAAIHIAHRCIPLNRDGFGKVMGSAMHACEYFYEKIIELKRVIEGVVTISVPFPPESNVLCYAINPKPNARLAFMNLFTRKVFSHLRMENTQALQAYQFFCSSTSIYRQKLDDRESQVILEEMGIDIASFAHPVKTPSVESDHIFLIRHIFINPWLMYREDDVNYIDRFFKYLHTTILSDYSALIARGQSGGTRGGPSPTHRSSPADRPSSGKAPT